MKNNMNSQAGIALIMVLLVVSIASVLTVSMASRQHIDIKRTVNVLEHEQAYMYLTFTEDLARFVLKEEFDDDRNKNEIKDTSEEMENLKFTQTVEGGTIGGEIYDLQGKFNINNLYQGQGASSNDVEVFQRLLTNQFNNRAGSVQGQQINVAMSDAIIDWIDSNQDEYSNDGGEDALYLRKELPYRTPNDYITSTSELLLMNGFSRDVYDSIKDFVIALPTQTKININTASEQILQSLSAQITSKDVQTIMNERDDKPKGKKGFDTVDEMLNIEAVRNKNINRELLSVTSDYFMVKSFAYIGEAEVEMFSIIYRNGSNGNTEVILRSQREI